MTQSPFDDAPAPISRPVESNTNTIAVPVIKRRSNALPIAIGALVLIGGGAFAACSSWAAILPAPKAAVVQAAKPGPAPQSASKAPAPTTAAPTRRGRRSCGRETNAAPAAAKPTPLGEQRGAQRRQGEREASGDERRGEEKTASPRQARAAGRRSARRAPRRARRAARAPQGPRHQGCDSPRSRRRAQPTPPAAAPPAGPKKDVNALLASLNKDKSKESAAGAGANAGNLPQRLRLVEAEEHVEAQKGAFNACYKKMAERPAGGITMNTSLIVAGSGSVKSVRITSGGGASAGVLPCITSALKARSSRPSRRPKCRSITPSLSAEALRPSVDRWGPLRAVILR